MKRKNKTTKYILAGLFLSSMMGERRTLLWKKSVIA